MRGARLQRQQQRGEPAPRVRAPERARCRIHQELDRFQARRRRCPRSSPDSNKGRSNGRCLARGLKKRRRARTRGSRGPRGGVGAHIKPRVRAAPRYTHVWGTRLIPAFSPTMHEPPGSETGREINRRPCGRTSSSAPRTVQRANVEAPWSATLEHVSCIHSAAALPHERTEESRIYHGEEHFSSFCNRWLFVL